jgi:hypothetical protein
MVLVELNSNTILVEGMKDCTSGKMICAHQHFVDHLKTAGIQPKHHILNNECSADFKGTITKNQMTYQLVPPNDHRLNITDCIASCCPLIAPPSCCLVAPAGFHITYRHPLIALPSRRLVAPAGGCIASCHPLLVPPSRQLVAPACCHIASPCPLVVSRTALLSSCCASWLLRCLSTHCPLVVLLSCCLVVLLSCCLVVSLSHCLVVSLSRCLVVSLSHCLVVLLSRCLVVSLSHCLVMPPLVVSLCQLVVAPSSFGFLSLHRPLVLSLVVALPLLAPPSRPLVVVYRRCHQTPSNAAAAIKYHHHHRN